MAGKNENDDEVFTTFVSQFATLFQQCVNEYYARLDEGITKSGKYADFLAKFTEARGSLEAVGDNGEKAGALVCLSIFHEACNSIGKKYNKNQLEKLIYPLYAFKENEEASLEEVVKAGIEVFRLYEWQIMEVSFEDVGGRNTKKLVEDAVDRVFQYFKSLTSKKNRPTQFTGEKMIKGVIYGKSKHYNSKTTGFPHICQSGHTVTLASKKQWNTSEIFECVGVQTLDGNGDVLRRYKTTSDCNPDKYFFRLAYAGEDTTTYKPFKVSLPVKYRYIYPMIDKEQLFDSLLKKVSTRRLNEHIKSSIKEDVACLISEIELKIDENRSALMNYFEKNNIFLIELIKKSCMDQKNYLDESLKQQFELIKQSSHWSFVSVPKVVNTPAVHFDVIKNVRALVKRNHVLDSINNGLNDGIVVLFGLGGVGKSEMARRFANIRKNSETNVIWINSLTSQTIKNSFHRLSSHFPDIKIKNKDKDERDIEAIVGDIYKKLTGRSNVIIFDDAASLGAIEKILPSTLVSSDVKFDVLVTSNGIFWNSSRMIINQIKLEEFTPVEAKEFVMEALLGTSIQEESVDELVESLFYHPLALEQATAYIKEANLNGFLSYSVEDYLKDYKENPKRLMDSNVHTDGYRKTMYRTVEMTIEKIKLHKLGEYAVELLHIMAYLLPSDIPRDLFLEVVDNSQEKFDVILDLLKKYSIIKSSEHGLLSIHGLIQQAIRLQIQEISENNNDVLATAPRMEQETLKKCLQLLYNKKGNSMNHIVCVWNYACIYEPLLKKLVLSENTDVSQTMMKQGNDKAALALAKCYASCRVRSNSVPFKEATKRNQLEIVQVLFKAYGTDYLNAETENGERPVHYSSGCGFLDVLKFLVKNGASVHVRDNNRKTPMHHAAGGGHTATLKYLITKRGIINATNRNGQTPVHCAASSGHTDALKCLIVKRGKVNQKDYDGETPAHCAAWGGHIDALKYLIDSGADVHVKDRNGSTLVHVAAWGGHIDVLKYLVEEKKLNYNAIDNSGCHALHYAVQIAWFPGAQDVVKYLVMEKGVDVNIQDMNGKTPLHHAVVAAVDCIGKVVDIVRLLTQDLGADPDIEDHDGYSPLFYAGHSSIVRLLVLHSLFRRGNFSWRDEELNN